METDHWEYDPNEIVTGTQDLQGHSVSYRVTMPKYWGGILAELRDSVTWPEYRSVQDIIRDALWHRVYWIGQQKNRGQVPGLREAMRRESWISRLTAEQARQQHQAALVRELQSTLRMMLNAGDVDGSVKLLKEAEELLDDLEEPYRSRFAEQLEVCRAQVEGQR